MLYSATLKVTSGLSSDLYRSSSYATVGVFVTHGVIVAAVRGAYLRQVYNDFYIEHYVNEYSIVTPYFFPIFRLLRILF